MNKKQKIFHLVITLLMFIASLLVLFSCGKKTEYVCEYEVQSTDIPIHVYFNNEKGILKEVTVNNKKWNYLFKAKTGQTLYLKAKNDKLASVMGEIFVNNISVAFKLESNSNPEVELMYILP